MADVHKLYLRSGTGQYFGHKQLPSDVALETTGSGTADDPYVVVQGSGGGLTSVSYAELVAIIGSSGLTAGAQYLITDYATKHYIVDAAATQYLGTIITGVNEALIVTANSANTIDKNAKSALHPEDVIYYDWNPDNWIDDLSFADLSGTPTIVTGFKGVIYFRHDTLLDNYMGYDFRNCKFRRWATDAVTWDSGTSYFKGDWVTHSGFIYRSLQSSNVNNTPANGSDFWIQILDLSQTVYWNNRPDASQGSGIPSNNADFVDVKTFAENNGGTYEACVTGNHFMTFKDNNTYYEATATILMNNVFWLSDEGYWTALMNNFSMMFYGNTLGKNIFYNSFGTYCTFNTISKNFIINTVVNLYNGSIGNNCNNNYLDNNFGGNTIGENFGNNTVGNSFHDNIVGSGFSNNTISNSFKSNTIGNSFQNNEVANGLTAGIDFIGATHVYAAYNCTIFLNASSVAKLSYFDGSNVLTVVNANA